jgi:hypothetical protein
VTTPEFDTFKTPADTLWLTPDASGIRFFLTPPDLNGEELVGVQFRDDRAGAFALAIHPESVDVFIEGLQNIVANIENLRTLRNPNGNGNTTP